MELEMYSGLTKMSDFACHFPRFAKKNYSGMMKWKRFHFFTYQLLFMQQYSINSYKKHHESVNRNQKNLINQPS